MTINPLQNADISLRIPSAEDGNAVFKLISECHPLDTNSMYCNLLQCTHFANTSVAANYQNQLVGFISGYIIPERPDTLFIWQVAVAKKARSQGLATRMLAEILNRSQCRRVSYLETTITQSNQSSWALFNRLTDKLSTQMKTSLMFDKDIHFKGKHDSEILVRIGSFNPLLIANNQ